MVQNTQTKPKAKRPVACIAVSSDLHRKAKIKAAEQGIGIGRLYDLAMQEFLACKQNQ